MGREIKRVPVDFDWPLNKTWHGYLLPDSLKALPCPDCEQSGYSPYGRVLHDLWYGKLSFSPESNGSVPFTPDHPVVRVHAERNVAQSPEYYGLGEEAVRREAERLADLFNSQWSHHLNDDDVAALVEANRLVDFTHTWTRETGWQKVEPPVIPAAAQVNEWSLGGWGHDSLNAMVVIKARCKRLGYEERCATCGGSADIEVYPGQHGEAEAWIPTEPPSGDGWQMWETVSQGSPVSPAFATDEELAQWLTTIDGSQAAGVYKKCLTIEQARAFVQSGWAPTMVQTDEGKILKGVEVAGTKE